MSGKAISRAVRAHLLLDAVLNRLLLSKSMKVPLPCAAGVEQDDAESSDKTPCTNRDLKAAESLYDELMAMTKDADEVANDEAIARIQSHPRRPRGNTGEISNGQFVDTIPRYDTDSP